MSVDYPVNNIYNRYSDTQKEHLLEVGDELSKLCSPSQRVYHSSYSSNKIYPRSMTGVQLLSSLVGKLMRVLFPPDLDLVKISYTDASKRAVSNMFAENLEKGIQELKAMNKSAFEISEDAGLLLTEIDNQVDDFSFSLTLLNKRMREIMNSHYVRNRISESLKYCTLYGNSLLQWSMMNDKPSYLVYNLDEFSILTDRSGRIVELVVYDLVYFDTIPPKYREKLEKTPHTSDDIEEICHKIYYYHISFEKTVQTFYTRQFISKDHFREGIKGKRKLFDPKQYGTGNYSVVKSVETVDVDDFIHVGGEEVSRGSYYKPLVEDVKGGLTYLDEMYAKLFNTMTSISNERHILDSSEVKPTPEEFSEFLRGEMVLKCKPVNYASYPSGHKANEVATLFAPLNAYSQDILKQFGQFNPEQKERTTATYIQRYILEIEQLLSNTYNSLSENLQSKVFDRVYRHVAKEMKLSKQFQSNLELNILKGAQLFSRQSKNIEISEVLPILQNIAITAQTNPYLDVYGSMREVLNNANLSNLLEDKQLKDKSLSLVNGLRQEQQIEANEEVRDDERTQ